MPDYAIRPDDRGWPMAHEVHADGSVAVHYAGAFIGPRPVVFAVTVNAVFIPDATIEVDWYHVGPIVDGPSHLWAGGWMIVSNASVVATLRESDVSIPLQLGGRSSTGAWNGPLRIRGVTPFPFNVDEWDALTGIPTLIRPEPPKPAPLPPKPWWHLF